MRQVELSQAYRESKAISPIKNSLKGYFAKKLVNDMRENDAVQVKQAMFKVADGQGRTAFLKLTIKSNGETHKLTV